MGQTLQQASNNWQRDETLSKTTMNRYTYSAIYDPDDAFLLLSNAIIQNGNYFYRANNNGTRTEFLRVLYGTYVGNGQYGSSTPTSVSVNGTPYMLFVSLLNNTGAISTTTIMMSVRNQNGVVISKETSGNSNNTYGFSNTITWSSNNISWYGSVDAYYQMNENGKTYHYVVFYMA